MYELPYVKDSRRFYASVNRMPDVAADIRNNILSENCVENRCDNPEDELVSASLPNPIC